MAITGGENSTKESLFTKPLQNQNLTEWQMPSLEELTHAGVECLNKSWAEVAAEPIEEPFCKPFWDNEYCWSATPLGERLIQPCSYGESSGNETLGNVERICYDSAVWSGLNSTCVSLLKTLPELWDTKEVIRLVLFLASVVSLMFLGAAIFIFCYFKSIRCDRITVHIQFMIALAIKSLALVIISDPNLLGDAYYYRSYAWTCKLVITVHIYAYMSSIFWMLVQGHFLNSKLTTNIFQQKSHLKHYVMFGWGLPLVLICIWIAVMEIYHVNSAHPCWKGYSKTNFIWIVGVPVLMSLFTNVLFLSNIMRILLRKIQLTSTATEREQIRRASKATAALFPLLGINNLIFFYNPGGSGEAYYMMANAILQPLQGVLVSVLYCFICDDVKLAIKREWRRFSTKRSISTSRKSKGENKDFASSLRVKFTNISPQSTQIGDIEVNIIEVP